VQQEVPEMSWWLEAHGRGSLPALKPSNTNAWAKLHVHVKLSQLLFLIPKIICSNIATSNRLRVSKWKKSLR
jgi:hypothetical protein